jgi:glycosyltransferase involved in cell wall biosynthesis
MRKIVFVLTDIYKGGGVQRVTSIIANKLIDRYKIELISIFASSDKVSYSLDERIKVVHLFDKHFDLRKHSIKVLSSLKKALQQASCDIVISDGIGLSSFVFIATLGKKVHRIGWEHQCYYFGKRWGLEWIGKKIACLYFDSIIVLTKRDYQFYFKQRPKAKIVQIYNPSEIEKCSDLYNPDGNRIISCGGLTPQKGFDYVIAIGQHIFFKYPNWQWDIYGEGPERENLQNQIAASGLGNNIFLKGYSDNIYSIYPEYAIYCMTSRHEGFPMVLLEAEAFHLPIISFDCNCGPSEMIDNDINGFLIPCYNVKEYSIKLLSLMEDREKRVFLSRNAVKRNDLFMDKVLEKWNMLLSQFM